jgi:hypothetical protein
MTRGWEPKTRPEANAKKTQDVQCEGGGERVLRENALRLADGLRQLPFRGRLCRRQPTQPLNLLELLGANVQTRPVEIGLTTATWTARRCHKQRPSLTRSR